jgi:hypothetical protein
MKPKPARQSQMRFGYRSWSGVPPVTLHMMTQGGWGGQGEMGGNTKLQIPSTRKAPKVQSSIGQSWSCGVAVSAGKFPAPLRSSGDHDGGQGSLPSSRCALPPSLKSSQGGWDGGRGTLRWRADSDFRRVDAICSVDPGWAGSGGILALGGRGDGLDGRYGQDGRREQWGWQRSIFRLAVPAVAVPNVGCGGEWEFAGQWFPPVSFGVPGELEESEE